MARISEATPLVLGSASPRRREILKHARIAHVVAPADVDERPLDGESPAPYLVRIVQAKLDAVRSALAAAVASAEDPSRTPVSRAVAVLVADTTVIDRGAILGKPANRAEARTMIDRLAGRTHEVYTRFAIALPAPNGPALHAETVATRVTFRALSDGEAGTYAESGEGLDKAGGYAVQGFGSTLVLRVEGSYTNVVGLPCAEVVIALRTLGLL